jgi:hypothetical protein
MKLLLHHCCAPCSPAAIDDLKKDFELSGFWFNPNIQPVEEHAKRKDSLTSYAEALKIPVFFTQENCPDIWNDKKYKDKTDRCKACYELRLKETALNAKKMGIDCFSTTLLSSPHQLHDVIRMIGGETAKKYELNFVYRDFRKDYYKGKDLARKAGYYIQNYCGCLPSRAEREMEKQKNV